MIVIVPRSGEWTRALGALDPSLPGADPTLFDFVAQELDRFHALGPFERRAAAFRILDALAGWARVWAGQGTRFERVFQRLWDPVQGWLRTEIVDVFSGEAAVITSVPSPRYLVAQSVGASILLCVFHPAGRALAAVHLGASCPVAGVLDALVDTVERRVVGGWNGAEMVAQLLGGVVGRDDERIAALESGLLGKGVPAPRVQRQLCPRREDDGPVHLVFDRTEGWVRPFHPGYDPVHYNLRTVRERERARIEGLAPSPALLWPFEETR